MVQDAARALQERSGGWCIVKRGAEGCLAAGPGRAEFSVPAPQVPVVDTTGAGDAFNAGIVRARLDDLPWSEAAGFATLLASTVVSRPSRGRYPRLDDLPGSSARESFSLGGSLGAATADSGEHVG
jgi:sugar/nucleoside kinase (ribokinase family)